MKYKNACDKNLWKSCANGDEKAYGELFERYFVRMFNMADRYMKDTMEAEEIVMDCFFNLWTKRGKINIRGDFPNYLSRCVRNSIVSHLRRRILLTINLESVANRCLSEYAADHSVTADDAMRTYRAALEKMPPRRLQAFRMSREENLNYAQIAQKMNISVSAVDNYVNAAVKELWLDMGKHLPLLLPLFLKFIQY
jgi:RNA polymerase sigma-70 factor (ECF subfamily)